MSTKPTPLKNNSSGDSNSDPINAEPIDADPIGEIADEFIEELRRGTQPSVEDYADRYPQLADEIRDLLPTLMLMEQARGIAESDESLGQLASHDPGMIGRVLGDYRVIREVGRGGMGVVYEAEQVSLGRRVALKVLPQQYLGDSKQRRRFEREARAAAKLHHTNIVPVFGVGTHEGVSYFVMQYIQGLGLDEVLEELQRLRSGQQIDNPDKWPEPGEIAQPSAVALARSIQIGEFARVEPGDSAVSQAMPDRSSDHRHASSSAEQASSGDAQHSDARSSEHDASKDLVSDMFSLSGSSVSGLIGSDSSGSGTSSRSSYWLSVARIGIQVSDALHYAHQQGITHRDIKPGNLLLDLSNTVWVTDFGLAKAEDQHNLTHTGDLLGTLRYMPPEAFEGKSDIRGDIYSLGITLYELITLRPAFKDSDRRFLIRRITEGDVARLPPDVPKDLATIVHKAIEHDVADRYQSANLLEEDLTRFLNDEPIRARNPSKTERALRWSRRNRALAGSLAGILSLLFVIASIMSFAAIYYRNQQNVQASLYAESRELGVQNSRLLAETRAAEATAVEAGEALHRTIYSEQMWIAHQSMSQHRGLAKTNDILEDWTPGEDEEDLRGWEWYYIHSLCNRQEFSLAGHTATIRGLDWRKDGKLIASASDDGSVRIWNLETRALHTTLDSGLDRAICTAWSTDGSMIAIGGPGGLSIWNVDSGERIFEAARERLVYGVAWSPDGSRLAAAIKKRATEKKPGEIQIYQTSDWTRRGGLVQTQIGYYNTKIGWNPTGQLLANPANISNPGLRPSQGVAVWNLASGQRLRLFRGHRQEVQAVSFNPNGRGFLASASRDATIKIWDLRAQNDPELDALHAECLGHTHGVASIAWHPEGEVIASAGWDGTARLWNSHSGRELAKFSCHMHHCFAIAWSPDGKQLATAGDDNLIKFWNPESQGDSSTMLATPDTLSARLTRQPNGDRVLRLSRTGELSLWDSKSLDRVEIGELPDTTFLDACYAPDGVSAITVSGPTRDQRLVEMFDLKSGRAIRDFEDPTASSETDVTETGATRPDPIRAIKSLGNGLLCGHGRNGPVHLWNVESGKLVRSLGDKIKRIRTVSLSPSGRTLGIGTVGGQLHLLDLETGDSRMFEPQPKQWLEAIDWSPDETRYATSGHHLAQIWDASTDKLLATLSNHHETVVHVDWSPDGSRLITGDARGQITVWDPDLAKPSLVLTTPIGSLVSAAWSPDGYRIIACSDEKIIVWDAENGYKAADQSPDR